MKKKEESSIVEKSDPSLVAVKMIVIEKQVHGFKSQLPLESR